MLQRLDSIEVTMATDKATLLDNIRKTQGRGLPAAHELPEWRDRAPIAIIGGGPSFSQTAEAAKCFRNIIVAGSAHDYAIEQGVKPRWTVICDPNPATADYLRRPVQGCRYLVASHCCDEIFDALKGYDVATWNAGGAIEEADEVWGKEGAILVGGGCTVGLRAIIFATIFGFSEVHLFGMDTCMDGERHHAYEFRSDKEESLCLKGLTEVKIGSEAGKSFMMSGYQIGQMVGFKEILNFYSDKVKFIVHGGGVLAELLRLGTEEAQRQAVA